LDVRILLSQSVDHCKINAGNVTVVIGESDALNPFCAALFNPGLQSIEGVRAHLVALGVRVVITGRKHKRLLSLLDELPLLRQLFNGFLPEHTI
jgi:hypothetical protein